MALFDAYIFIDWSAVNHPHPQQPAANAVWIGESIPALRHQKESYHQTRHDAFEYVLTFILDQVKGRRRVLVGFDFPYGYPVGLAEALGLGAGGEAWSHVWAELEKQVEDTPANVNNRFEVASALNARINPEGAGPFWGCPAGRATQNLSTHSPGFPFECANGVHLRRLRITERRLRGAQETWKLFGAGSVGSQAIVGIPYVHRLRHHPEICHHSKVWPFETGFTEAPSQKTGPFILHAEIWPGVVEQQYQDILAADPQLIRDQAQVRAMCKWASKLDVEGKLGQYFATPNGLTAKQKQICTEQEGWVLGAR
ncbi:cobalamin biosynthesis protein CbiG [Candidatus Parcubacteria bacterium]|nr:MAG: cobalamin biosynthesis protein CbiG [Candidatus Parcubacteria bacterium]